MNTIPAIPLQTGRRPHEIYHPQHQPHHPQYYHGYQQPYPPPQHYPQQHPQWYPSPAYQPMTIPIPRPYQHYPPMVNPPYPGSPSPMQHRPHPPHHTSSVHSREILSPASSNASLHVPPPALMNAPRPQTLPPPPSQRMPYYPPLPWYSFAEGVFPSRGPRRRRKRPRRQSSSARIELPSRGNPPSNPETPRETPSEDQTIRPTYQEPALQDSRPEPQNTPQEPETPDQLTPVPEPSDLETPATSQAPSETGSTQPTTPSSATAPASTRPQPARKPKISHRPTPSIPIVPAIPNISLPSRPARKAPLTATSASDVSKATEEPPSNADHLANAVGVAAQAKEDESTPSEENPTSAPAAKTAPKSWADLVRTMAPPKSSPVVTETASSSHTNGILPTKAESLGDALSSYSVEGIRDRSKIAFLEPRGLVNTGNMCYMNSILQTLVFCIPFFNFLDHIGKRAAHSFKSDTPLMDAMIMFMREFPVIDSAVSVEQLRMRLKANELEQYGEAFIPEFVYQVIRRLPRFSSMRRGHQQDAEEFLGFILEEMHDECGRSMRYQACQASSSGTSTPTNGVPPSSSETSEPTIVPEEWLEVGRKQKAAITRSSGSIAAESPITKIFGGKLRSELRVPGMKNSVTLEPYQPLQLDIGAPNVNNIIDALKGLTCSETLHGEFNSPRGPGSNATKQVTIETLPQVLILHLKRFQYDNTGGTQKIWKKIGYPLDLEIPKEVFPHHKRAGLVAHGGLPKYRLIGVVYHHGKNASGGHYTVDVRRQDGREWIRLDDTIIRRVRSEDVAEGGSEEDPKILAAALEQHKNDSTKSDNVYEQLEEEENPQAEKEWSHVNGAAPPNKKWAGIVNGSATPSTASGKMTPVGRPPVKDNKVAYLLFYQKVSG